MWFSLRAFPSIPIKLNLNLTLTQLIKIIQPQLSPTWHWLSLDRGNHQLTSAISSSSNSKFRSFQHHLEVESKFLIFNLQNFSSSSNKSEGHEVNNQLINKVKIMPLPQQGKPNVVFVLGPPGSGKGTQCSKIVETFGYVHLSAGDLLREERNNPSSEFGELIETHIRNGTIVPVEITCSLLENAMQKKQLDGFNYFLIDGFPRSQNNLDGWTKQMSEKVNFLFVLFLTSDEEICVGRCLGRGEGGSGRSDDNPESLKKRIVTYNNTTMPIIQHYMALDLVHTVDASPGAEVVFEQIKPIFENFAPSK